MRAFIPPGLPPNPPVELAGLYQHLDRANQALGRLDGLTTLLPDTKFFLYLYIQKEALLSSQIEGTQSSFRTYCCLKMTPNRVFRFTMSKKSQTTSPRCNMGFVGSRAAFRSLSDSSAKFTPSCCVADVEPTAPRRTPPVSQNWVGRNASRATPCLFPSARAVDGVSRQP